MVGTSLSKDQLNRLVEHKYHCEGESICDILFKNFWRISSLYIPTSIAPNTLTLIGLFANVFALCLLLSYGAGSVTSLVFVLCVFIYQTLDALDGLHARRTGSCSQLGELFDHGCDTLATCILPICYFIIIGFDEWPVLMFIQYLLIQALFYVAHWRCYVTGILSFDRVGVTEGLVIGMVFGTITSLLGSSFWSIKDPLFGLELKVVQFLVFSVVMFLLSVQFADTISQGGCGKYGTTVANTSVLFPVCPLALAFSLPILIAINSPVNLYHQSPFIFLLTFGIIFAKVSQRLVLAHMTKSAISLFDSVMFGAALLLINQYFSCPVSELLVLWISLIFGAMNIMVYDVDVCIQLANFLNIYVFRIGRLSSTRNNTKNTLVNSSVQGSTHKNSHRIRNSSHNR
ncbi:Cholinephosphotransferase 1 isoform 1 [Schistosoma japonicum]|uniref:Cholinephosphotransferase 1 isoform 1 n=2 Tax=Schistosoma japonicum TaxID=6182 RepID=C1L404_SCHJA|nr:Cholinephosphotransferase 1 [Schistosoma japonicum]TNN19027.1 Cholinephosphotransferase 1 isoform 1 [Schistosoma japonicum]CAX69432.1 putative choline phosphotransferase 1 [Schistosoma japonicum]